MPEEDPFARAEQVFEAAADGRATLAQAREAMMLISDYRPRGMDPQEAGEKGSVERHYADAANSFKMALDALEGDQMVLAKSYLGVAKIKLEKAREG